jgi:hypothetical protein
MIINVTTPYCVVCETNSTATIAEESLKNRYTVLHLSVTNMNGYRNKI